MDTHMNTLLQASNGQYSPPQSLHEAEMAASLSFSLGSAFTMDSLPLKAPNIPQHQQSDHFGQDFGQTLTGDENSGLSRKRRRLDDETLSNFEHDRAQEQRMLHDRK